MNFYAIPSIQSVLNVLSFWIQLVKHYVCVWFVAGSEGNNFVNSRDSFDETDSVGSNCDVRLSSRAILYLNRQHDVMRFRRILLTMNYSFIDVQNQCLLSHVRLGPRQVYLLFLYFRKRGWLYLVVISEHFQRHNQVLECTLVLSLNGSSQMGQVVCFEFGKRTQIHLAAEELQFAVTASNSCCRFFANRRFG